MVSAILGREYVAVGPPSDSSAVDAAPSVVDCSRLPSAVDGTPSVVRSSRLLRGFTLKPLKGHLEKKNPPPPPCASAAARCRGGGDSGGKTQNGSRGSVKQTVWKPRSVVQM